MRLPQAGGASHLYGQAPQLVEGTSCIHEPLRIDGDEVGCASRCQAYLGRVHRTYVQHLPVHTIPKKGYASRTNHGFLLIVHDLDISGQIGP